MVAKDLVSEGDNVYYLILIDPDNTGFRGPFTNMDYL